MRARERGRGRPSAALAAVSFLTRLRIGRADVGPEDLARGVPFFPLVGALVGAATAGIAIAARHPFPVPLAAILAVGFQVVVTGAFHLDGLADTADSYGASSRERALEIMRDAATGTFGTVAIVLDVALKSTAVALLLGSGDLLGPFVAASALGATAVLIGSALPYAGVHGTGSFAGDVRARSAWATAALAALIAAAAIRIEALPAIGVAAGVGVLWAVHGRRRLGGYTGDTLGAAAELIQISVLLTLVALRS
jgi:adenosylcobinamide-GDP ribazoletransferase